MTPARVSPRESRLAPAFLAAVSLAGVITSYRRAVTDGMCVRRCLRVAIVVGTILTLINHGDALVAGELSAVLAVKVGLNYVVPFIVCLAGFATALHAARGPRPDG